MKTNNSSDSGNVFLLPASVLNNQVKSLEVIRENWGHHDLGTKLFFYMFVFIFIDMLGEIHTFA